MSAASFRRHGRILFLSERAGLIEAQLAGRDLTEQEAGALRGDVSTDEITPGWTCYYFDERLGRYPYVGLRCGDCCPVTAGSVAHGGFEVTVAGTRYGKGSSREASPYAEKLAGIRLVIAESFERIYRQNCHNLGLLTSTDRSLIGRLQRGEAIPLEDFTRGLDPISAEIVRCGGLFAFTRKRLAGAVKTAGLQPVSRPLSYAEKIILRAGSVPGDAPAALRAGTGVLVRADWRYSHEYVTPVAAAFLDREMGPGYRITRPDRVICFADHFSFLEQSMPAERKAMGLLTAAQEMARAQASFCEQQNVRLHGYLRDQPGSEGICHSIMSERYVLPGQVVVGTDSHTPHCGALGAFAFGIGTSEMASAWLTGDARLTVPEVCRIELKGKLPAGVDAKDIALHILQSPYVRDGHAVGQLIEYGGEVLAGLSTDARATLTNMVAEVGGLTGIVVPDAETVRFIAQRRGVQLVLEPWMCSDPGCAYAHWIEINCSALAPMVARPGDPGRGLRVDRLEAPVPISIAYGGSCTGGKREDLVRYHEVLSWAVERGLKVACGVQFYLQFSSSDVRTWCKQQGMLRTFELAGVQLVQPGCGACLNAGPGISESASDVTISAINRNFPGRSGPGAMWLGSPSTVAASAIAGRIVSFEQLRKLHAESQEE